MDTSDSNTAVTSAGDNQTPAAGGDSNQSPGNAGKEGEDMDTSEGGAKTSESGAKSADSAKKDKDKGGSGSEGGEKKKEPEPDFQNLSNPARVLPQQVRDMCVCNLLLLLEFSTLVWLSLAFHHPRVGMLPFCQGLKFVVLSIVGYVTFHGECVCEKNKARSVYMCVCPSMLPVWSAS